MSEKIQVWMCGGGTQSICIAALILRGILPKPDFSLIADTGHEVESTWEYLDNVLTPNLKKVGVQLVRVFASELSYCGTSLFNREGTLLIPAYTTECGKGKLETYCNGYWKRDVLGRYLSLQGVTESMRCKWIGFSRDEYKRILKMQQGSEYKAGLVRFPLLEQMLTRVDCVRIIRKMGWPKPPKSRCKFCPNQNDEEWSSLSADEFSYSVSVEKEIQKKDPCAWLHRSCVPLGQVDFSKPESIFDRPCDSGMCFL